MRRSAKVWSGDMDRRLTALEQAVAAMAIEVQTSRLTVTDRDGRPRIVAEVDHDTAELRLEARGEIRRSRDRGPAVVLFATPGVTGLDEGRGGLGPAVGLQLWADGDAVAELDAWPGDSGRWRAQVHLEEGSAAG